MAEVTEINDLETLDAYRATWNTLFDQTPNATFFQTFEWLSLFWQHFGQGHRLRVLVVRGPHEVLGIVPLWVQTQQHKLGAVRTLGYPLDGWGNFYGPLGPEPEATLAHAMQHLAGTHRDWDRLQLDWVAHDTTDHGLTQQGMARAGLRPVVTPSGATSLVDIAQGWDAYLAGRGSKTRHQLRHYVRRVSQAGTLSYIRHRPESLQSGDGDPRWDLYESCQRVAERSWQSHCTDGNTLCHPRYRDFYRATHAAAARLGMLDLNLLAVDGQPVAFNYNYVHGGQVTGLRMGYDPRAASASVGLSLLAMLLQDSGQRGDKVVDLGIGDQPFKRRLRTSEQHLYALTHTPLTALRSQALRLGHWLRHTAAAHAQSA